MGRKEANQPNKQKNMNPSLVLVQPRKTRPYITERLLMGRRESNQAKKTLEKLVNFNQVCNNSRIINVIFYFNHNKNMLEMTKF